MVTSFALVSTGLPAAQAATISTTAMMHQSDVANQRAKISAMLKRQDVRKELLKLGVNPADVQARVNSLTDHQVQTLADRMNQLPAGGSSLLGVLVFIFVLLLITDILGFTDVFPFVKKTVR
ncbi:MAG: PA2779 family protein [Gammaproteobacteria bacterium]